MMFLGERVQPFLAWARGDIDLPHVYLTCRRDAHVLQRHVGLDLEHTSAHSMVHVLCRAKPYMFGAKNIPRAITWSSLRFANDVILDYDVASCCFASS